MLKRLMKARVTIPLAGLALVGALFLRPQIGLADYQPPSYLDAQTLVVSLHMRRVSAGVWDCAGACRTAQTGGANPKSCLLQEATAATPAACITALNADCTPQNVIICATGAAQ